MVKRQFPLKRKVTGGNSKGEVHRRFGMADKSDLTSPKRYQETVKYFKKQKEIIISIF